MGGSRIYMRKLSLYTLQCNAYTTTSNSRAWMSDFDGLLLYMYIQCLGYDKCLEATDYPLCVLFLSCAVCYNISATTNHFLPEHNIYKIQPPKSHPSWDADSPLIYLFILRDGSFWHSQFSWLSYHLVSVYLNQHCIMCAKANVGRAAFAGCLVCVYLCHLKKEMFSLSFCCWTVSRKYIKNSRENLTYKKDNGADFWIRNIVDCNPIYVHSYF